MMGYYANKPSFQPGKWVLKWLRREDWEYSKKPQKWPLLAFWERFRGVLSGCWQWFCGRLVQQKMCKRSGDFAGSLAKDVKMVGLGLGGVSGEIERVA
jgi:hypothetical protein